MLIYFKDAVVEVLEENTLTVFICDECFLST